MGHVVGAASGVTVVQLAVNLLVASRPGRRPSPPLDVLRALARPPTAREAASERRAVAAVLEVVRAQRAADERAAR